MFSLTEESFQGLPLILAIDSDDGCGLFTKDLMADSHYKVDVPTTLPDGHLRSCYKKWLRKQIKLLTDQAFSLEAIIIFQEAVTITYKD